MAPTKVDPAQPWAWRSCRFIGGYAFVWGVLLLGTSCELFYAQDVALNSAEA